MLKLIPKTIRRKMERPLKKLFYFGTKRYCPVCGSKVRAFQPGSRDNRPDASCPICNSYERMRMLWSFIHFKDNELFQKPSGRILHIAPEKEIEKYLRNKSDMDYLSADMEDKNTMVQMDIREIQYEDNYFDLIILCHVLEHIPEDIKALNELYRVLRPNGSVIIQIPGPLKKTYEDFSEMDPDDRKFVFRHQSHYHLYGFDLVDRMKAAGFSAKCYIASDLLDEQKCRLYGMSGQRVFFGKK